MLLNESSKKMNAELSWHIIIIWDNTRTKIKNVFDDIKKKFQIREVFEITWTPKLISENLQRFYGANLPDPDEKAKLCGNGAFLVILFTDYHPKFGKRGTSYGMQLVNTNVYDAKMKYRSWLSGGYPIHGSNNERETTHDLTLLIGKNLEDVMKNLPREWDGITKKLNQDLIGYDGWKNINELFYVLNSTTNYVVLRNFEGFPDLLTSERHRDIDILTDDLWQIPYIVNKRVSPENEEGLRPYVKVGQDKIKFDFRYPGDNYYDSRWENDLLKGRVLSEKGFYIPDDVNYFYSLLYHMIIHKKAIFDEYLDRLVILSSKINKKIERSDLKSFKRVLDEFMRENNYRYTNSLSYKILHNEFTRLTITSIKLARKRGLRAFIYAAKHKLYRVELVKSGRI